MGRRAKSYASYQRALQAQTRRTQLAREAQQRAARQAAREDVIRAANQRAESQNRAIDERVQAIECLLSDGTRKAIGLDFHKLVNIPPRPSPSLDLAGTHEQEPQIDAFLPADHGFLNNVIPGGRQRYAARVEEAKAKHAAAKQDYEAREAARRARVRGEMEQHYQQVAAWQYQIDARLREADVLQNQVSVGDRGAVERGARLVLEQSDYPPGFTRAFTLEYSSALKSVSIHYELMGSDVVPDVAGYAYVQSKDEIKAKLRTDSQRKLLYNTYIASVALRSLYELFAALPAGVVETASFEGWVFGTDRARGIVDKFCLGSVAANRDEFRQLSLSQVDPVRCMAVLGGRLSRNALAQTPVEPIAVQTGRITSAAKRTARTTIQRSDPEVIDGRYRIIAKLGRGAFGTVLQVSDQQLQRVVALKLLHPHLAEDAEDRRRFIQEARALARVDHPNVVHVYDVSERASPPYFTMEFISGVSLAQALAQGVGLPLPRVLDITRKLCDALDCIHNLNLVHRDIKSDNIMLTPQSEPRLMDFGIALADGQTRLTGTGYGLGTPESAAPEQIGGGAVTKAVDIYALGILVFQMVTGHRPFEGNISHVLYAQANVIPPELQTIRPDISHALSRAVQTALAKHPADRPPSAGAFWHMLGMTSR